MNKYEQKIRDTENSEKGYDNEDRMLSDFMVWLNNTHQVNPIKLNPKKQKISPVNELMSIFHIENEGTFGGQYGAMQGAVSKGKGKKKGILDLESIYMGIPNFLEFKLEDGTFSDEQLYFIGLLVKWNIPVFIIRSGSGGFDFFKFVIENIILKGIKFPGDVYKSIQQIELS